MPTEGFLILAIASSAAMALALKIFQSDEGNRYGIILGNYLTCIVTAFIMIPDKSLLTQTDGKTALLGVIGGILFVVALVTMQSSIYYNGAILSSAFSKLGLLVPLALSILFWGERPGVLQIIGLLLVLAAVWIISGKEENARTGKGGIDEKKQLFLLIAVLLCFGMADAMAKVFERLGNREMDSAYFFILFCTAAILAVGLLLREKKRTGSKVLLRQLLAGIIVGIPNYFSSALLLKALVGLPAILVYPCFSTGTILIVTLISAVFLKERLDGRKITGLVIILAALILLNI